MYAHYLLNQNLTPRHLRMECPHSIPCRLHGEIPIRSRNQNNSIISTNIRKERRKGLAMILEVLVSHHLLKPPKLSIHNLEATPPIANWF